MKKFKKIITIFFIFFCLLLVFYEIQKDLDYINLAIKSEYKSLLYALLISIIASNILNVRFFYFLKIATKYSDNFINWSKLFFITSLMNLGFFGSGHILRASELKKKNLMYKEYVGIYYILVILSLLINLLLVSFEILILSKSSNLLIIYFFSIIILAFVFLNSNFLNSFKSLIEKLTETLSNFFFNNIKMTFIIIVNFIKNKKNITIFSFFTFLIHILEIIIFYLICILFLQKNNFEVILLLFILSFVLNRVPFIANLPGVNEVILGLIGSGLGLFFSESALIQLIARVVMYSSVLFNTLVYSTLHYLHKLITLKKIN